ncbi:hypothetical protein UFOVP687_19 [uncultured Caudovirales phage]|jgi:hypothetical protein|uniref:Uncharacterized protein n=1 Tax=uncultured Caudovirales phage TaxID=2100421 RepID=A0A6J5NL87_9CAUD|nr:hypothetical protein UFOVP414_37 [uncultured Caudovirales phage]CAB4157688.1 hypothetical protein UFOVP687_19 [uncultured Caudovirales phage]
MITPPQQNMDVAAQQKQPMQILESALRRALPDEEQVGLAQGALVEMLKAPENKLVHLGNSLFLVMVKAPGQVEVHTFSEETPQALAKNFIDLSKYLKNIGVKRATTYSDDPRFQKISEMTQLPVKVEQSVNMIGTEMRPVYRYTLEL